jgi:hypothetical protein
MKINELLSDIEKRNLVLPEFQREYVWNRDQAKKLMLSLMKKYPVGSLLFWKTDDPPELKNIDTLPEKLGTIDVILDGQQRLTTLYMLIKNDIPPYYTEAEIQTGDDPRNLYFDLLNGELGYYKPLEMKNDPLWLKVTDCFSENKESINVIKIAQETSENADDALSFSNIYLNNLNNLQNIKDMDIPIQNVPSNASMSDAITIFDLVNRQGTKLTDAELALTQMSGKWAHIRRAMKSKIDELRGKNFHFDLTFMVRSLVAVVSHRALYETVFDKSEEDLKTGWNRLSKILDYLVNILPQHANIHSNRDVNSNNVFIPLIAFLDLNEGRFPNDKSMKRAIHWLLAAHTQTRYSGQTDQKLEFDISLVVQNESPWESLIDAIIDQRGRVEIKPTELEGRGSRHPLYRMTYIMAKANNATDWFNGAPLALPHGKNYWVNSHHIFPSSLLYKSGYDSDNHLHKKIVNEIANRAFLTMETNNKISNRFPKDYLPEVEQRYPGALEKQFIPMNPELWEIDRYEDFLEVRRELISNHLKKHMESFIKEPEAKQEISIETLVKNEESSILEYKSSLQWDVVQNQQNKGLRKQVLKTIIAFLNSQGGTLVIGVEDDGTIYGIENDLNFYSNSVDKFLTTLSSLYIDYIGAEFTAYIQSEVQEVEGKKVCVVRVQKSRRPAYYSGPQGSEFFIRVGPSSRMLDAESTVKYQEDNWEV